MHLLVKAFIFCRGLDQGRIKVLDMDTKGNLYLYKSALLCKSEIIKKLTEDNYTLVEPSILGNTSTDLLMQLTRPLCYKFEYYDTSGTIRE